MRKLFPLALTSLFAFGACSSDLENLIDGTTQARIDTVEECFPDLYDKFEDLLQLAELWRFNNSTSPADPAELTWMEATDGTIDATLVIAGCTLDADISFFSPTGALQELDLSAATTLNEAIGAAATELRNLFAGQSPFIVGTWTMTGTGVSGSGSLTGIIGGTTNLNELETLSTTGPTPDGGPPAVASSSIQLTGTQTCSLTFEANGLQTDTVPDQQFPIGTINLTIQGEETATATITFDNTATATIDVSGVPGTFSFNLNTSEISFSP